MISSILGKVHLRMKGCWTNEGSCSNAECIDNTSVNRSMKFCCCNGDLCNAKYRFEATTVAPQMEENTLYPKQADELNWLLVFGIVIGIAFIVIVLIIVLCWIKRNSFNKVPTVCVLCEDFRSQSRIHSIFVYIYRMNQTYIVRICY